MLLSVKRPSCGDCSWATLELQIIYKINNNNKRDCPERNRHFIERKTPGSRSMFESDIDIDTTIAFAFPVGEAMSHNKYTIKAKKLSNVLFHV